MSIYGLTYGNNVSYLNSIGLETYDMNKYKEIKENSDILIYDQNGVVELDILKYLMGKACNIRYICEETSETAIKYLKSQNVFDIYIDKSVDEITNETILKIFEKRITKEENKKDLESFNEILTLNTCIETVQDFLNSIRDKNKNSIETIFNNSFNKMLSLNELFTDKQIEFESMRRENIRLNDSIKSLESKNNKLETEKIKIKESGIMVQEDNKKMCQSVLMFKTSIDEKEKVIAELKDQISGSAMEKTEIIEELNEEKNKTLALTNNLNKIKMDYDNLLKQVDKLQETLKSTSVKSNNISINLTDTIGLNKILYIKVIDKIPFIIDSFRQYLRYFRNKGRRCGMVIVFPKNNFGLNQYGDTFKKLTETCKIEDAENSIYMMDDFSIAIENYISNANLENVIILDMTEKQLIMTSTAKQKNIYIINNENSLLTNNINPKDCISFCNLKSAGVTTRIPLLDFSENGSLGKNSILLRESLFLGVDNWW